VVYKTEFRKKRISCLMISQGLQAALGRMDHLLMLSIVTFTERVIRRYLLGQDVLFIAMTMTMITFGYDYYQASDTNSIAFMFHKVSCLLFFQGIISYIHPIEETSYSTLQAIIFWLQSTGFVMFVAIMQHRFQNTIAGQQVTRLVYYMYGASTAFLTFDMQFNRCLPFICALVIACIQQAYIDYNKRSWVFDSILDIVNMTMVNVIISILFQSNENVADKLEHFICLVALLLILDNLHNIFQCTDDFKGYATWQASRVASSIFIAFNLKTDSMVIVAVLSALFFILLSELFKYSSNKLRVSILVDLSLLVAGNSILEYVTSDLRAASKQMVALVLVSALISLHATIAVLQRY
jgi:hypothetical protein